MQRLYTLRRLAMSLAILALFATSRDSAAQGEEPFYIGIGGAANFNFHSLSVPVYRGSELCGVFKEGDGIKPAFHLMTEFKPSGWPVWLSPRLTYNNFGGEITTSATDNARVRKPIDSSLVASNREHRLTANLPAIALDAYVKYRFSDIFYAFGGPNLGVLLSPSAAHTEVITAPADGIFDETGSNTRTLGDGDLVNASSFQAHFTLGAGGDVKVSERWVVAPEVSYSIPITNIRSDYDWKVSQLRAGISIKYDITPRPDPAPVIVQNGISGSIQLLGLERDANGTIREFETPLIRVEEFVSRDAHPILNSIFFDKNSGAIPARYAKRGVLDTNIMRGKNALEVNHNALDIIGYRLQRDPSHSVSLRGILTTEEEAANPRLGSDRASAIANYLMSRWGIDAARVSISTEVRPASTDPQLSQEQQRVEITSTDPALFDPFIIQTVTRTMNPPGLRVRTTLEADQPVLQSNIAVQQQGGFRIATPQRPQFDWFASNESELPSTEEPLIATLNAVTQDAKFSISDSTKVEQLTIRKKRTERIADVEVERYNLITFEFDKATLDARAERVMQIIGREATNWDTIEVVGYTDVIGETAYNQRLSTERAQSVERALRQSKQAPNALIASRGEGEMDLYDNTLPEGRQLSRTVRVTIKRPVNTTQEN